MQLNLTDEQAHALTIAIDSYYGDLREEIYHTDDTLCSPVLERSGAGVGADPRTVGAGVAGPHRRQCG